MRKPPPNGMDIRISMEDWNKLLAAEFESGFALEAWEIGAQAVHDWLARNSPETLSKPCTCGYQWKELFLPKGTLLRTVFNGRHYHCIVEEDGPRFNGEPTSPSRFANAVGGVRRNAWRVIWVLFPNTQEWKLADRLRTGRRAPSRPASRPGAGQRDASQPRSPVSKAEDERGQHRPQVVRQPGGESGCKDAAHAAPRQHAPVDRDRERRFPTERRIAYGERRRYAGDPAHDGLRCARPAAPCTATGVEPDLASDAATAGQSPLTRRARRDRDGRSSTARHSWAPVPSFVIRTARYARRRASSARLA